MDQAAPSEKQNRVVAEAFQCRRALEAYAYSMLKNRAEAEDIVQEAFIVVMEKYADFQEGTSMIAWTRTIVRLKVLQWLEKRNRRAKILDSLLYDALDAAFEEATSDQYAERVRARGQRLEYCLEKIREQPRKLLNHVYVDKMSYQAAAKSMGMRFEAAKKSLTRTKAQLRECVRKGPIDFQA